MNKAVLQEKKKSVLVSSIPIEIGVSRHFNYLERGILNKQTISNETFFETPLDYYKNLKILSESEVYYAFRLAFFQRIQLNIEDTFGSPVNYHNYPIELLDNFIKLDTLFEKHFDSFDKINADNLKFRNSFKDKIVKIVFKFWLCGYGILQGYTSKTISDVEINLLKNRSRNTKKLARFLATMLVDEPLSNVTFVPVTKEKITVLESEKAKWGELIKQNKSEIGQRFANFTFTVMKDRAEGGCLITYNDKDGTRRRHSLSSISWGTFRGYSSALLKFVNLIIVNGYVSVEQALSGGIIDTLSSESFYELPIDTRENIRTTLRAWLDFYSKTNELDININRIIPITFSNKETSYGKFINFGSAYSLISTLLDDTSDIFDENNLFDYRARRMCLIQLATGKRIHEVSILKKDCLNRNAEGNVFIHFHKTKNGEPHTLPASRDLINWVQDLQMISPDAKIKISTEQYTFGDNETDYRLTANIYNDGPIRPDSITNFLKRVQEKLWSNIDSARYYTSHDLRRMNAVYQKIKGKSSEDIQEQLGQLDISSQLPYLETKPPEIQNYFKMIAKEGIWSHITEKNENENVVSLEVVLKRSQKQGLSSKGRKSAKSFIEDIVSDVEKQVRKLPNNIGKSPVSTGFPLRTHNCLATEVISCGHTELHCFSCRSFFPDNDKLEEYKAEIFRHILLLSYNDDLAKKNKLEREIIVLRSKDIKELLDKTFNNLFQKLNYQTNDIKKLEKELYTKASSYYRKHKKEKPTLTFQEALIYIKTGVLNGK